MGGFYIFHHEIGEASSLFKVLDKVPQICIFYMELIGYTGGGKNLMKMKAHLVIPREILEEVDKIAGKRRRSLFIAEATQEKLERERFLKTLEETKGAWTDKNHPELKTSRDVERYVKEKRQSYRKRLKGIVNE